MQDLPYALFGTCLGAITAYEVAHCAIAAGLPPPAMLFTAAVSPPHIYAGAVAKLYLAQGEAAEGPEMMHNVLDKFAQLGQAAQGYRDAGQSSQLHLRHALPACQWPASQLVVMQWCWSGDLA